MIKIYCDKCGKEQKNADIVSLEFKAGIGNLKGKCFFEFCRGCAEKVSAMIEKREEF